MLFNAFKLALDAIRRNLLRASLTVLGVVIGVAAVITMVTLGNGATRAVSDQISSLGSNLLIVRPGQRMGPTAERAPSFRLGDVAAIIRNVPTVKAATAVESTSATVVYGARNWNTSIVGTTAAYLEVRDWSLAGGRAFTEAEERSGRAVCVVGDTIRRELFQGRDPVGARIRVKQFSCEVIGVLRAKGQAAMGQDQDDTVILPLRTVQRRLTGRQDVGSITIAVRDGASTARARTQVEAVLRERRNIGPGEDDNFGVMDTKQIAETLSGTTRVMTMLLGAVAAVSLLVGGIGIMNIMLVSVTERTKEIGVRLAIGALEQDVLLQFLVESVVLAAFGGLAGVLIAAVASAALAQVIQVPFLFDPAINLLAFAVAVMVGVVFGYVPARRAARLDPIEALRRE
ncbi:MAG TPA: ABC transporter permease [Caulobacter sp.]|mgnify:CR=1 FL=1|nr:ABC transporter permease [Caulobacter sp.]